MCAETIEEGFVISPRKVFQVGDSKAVTLSKKWLDIQKWLGNEVEEVVSVANSLVVLVPPDRKDEAIKFLKAWEKKGLESKEG